MTASNKKAGFISHAFTLSEVLITLAIIGVVAALTIPTLIQKSQEQNAVAQLKKTYNMLTNAYNLAVQENGQPETWGGGLISATSYDSAVAVKMMDAIKPYLKIEKDCGNDGTIKGCFPDKYYQYKNASSVWTNWVNMNTNGSQFARVRLADGSSMSAQYHSGGTNCSGSGYGSTPALLAICGIFYVDVDGEKGSSRLGQDLFGFWLTSYGIVPTGTSDELSSGNPAFDRCKANGWSCTAWVLYNENMDYLRCPASLSWAGAHSCP